MLPPGARRGLRQETEIPLASAAGRTDRRREAGRRGPRGHRESRCSARCRWTPEGDRSRDHEGRNGRFVTKRGPGNKVTAVGAVALGMPVQTLRVGGNRITQGRARWAGWSNALGQEAGMEPVPGTRPDRHLQGSTASGTQGHGGTWASSLPRGTVSQTGRKLGGRMGEERGKAADWRNSRLSGRAEELPGPGTIVPSPIRLPGSSGELNRFAQARLRQAETGKGVEVHTGQ